MRDLGTFRGVNNPGPLDFYPKLASDLCFAFIGFVALVVITFIIIFGWAVQVSPVAV